jgi:hypothetical protein
MGPDAEKQVTEVRETTTGTGAGAPVTPTTNDTVTRQTVATATTVPSSVVATRVVYYLGGALIALLLVRLILALLGANTDNAFASFIFGLSYPFVYPFFGLFGYEPSAGASTLELGTLTAIVVYGLLTVGIAKLLTLGSAHKDEV